MAAPEYAQEEKQRPALTDVAARLQGIHRDAEALHDRVRNVRFRIFGLSEPEDATNSKDVPTPVRSSLDELCHSIGALTKTLQALHNDFDEIERL